MLIVGAGPAGLVAAITLGRYGIPNLLVEKRTELSTLSRATVISTRSMEILRSWGLEESVQAGAAEVEPCGWVTPTLASGEGSVIRLGYPTKNSNHNEFCSLLKQTRQQPIARKPSWMCWWRS